MTFLNPLVLFGLIAAAIPLIIHLFNFRKPKRVDFSSLEFLKELQRSTMRRVRIKQWLLLLLRTLAIVCLVLAFARPTLQGPLAGTFGQRASSSVALVLDNSLSMSLRDTRGEYFTQAREIASDIIGEMKQGDELYLLPTAETNDASPDPYRNRGPAVDALAELEPEVGAESVGHALNRGVRLLERSLNLNKEIYLVSDLQRTTFLDSVRLDVPAGVQLFLVPVGERVHGNVAVTDVRVLSRIIEAGQPVRLEARLVNYGTEALEGYIVSVFLEGERVAQNTVNLDAGGRVTVPFTVTPQQRGWLGGEIHTEDDAFGQDNVRYFTLNVPERRTILVVRGDGQRTSYVELALSSDLTRGRVAFEVETIAESRLSATPLADYDAIVLSGLQRLSSGDVAKLSGYVQEGGGLLLFPGTDAAYNTLLTDLEGGRVTGYSGALGAGQSIASFDRVDREHPLFEGVFDQASAPNSQVESPDIYFAANYTGGSGNEQTLIRASNGQPFLQEIRHGEGIVLFCSVAPDVRWSDLPVRGFFIPFIYRSMFYLSSGDGETNDGLLVGSAGALRVAGSTEGEALRLLAPDGEELTPEQRTLFGGTLIQTPASLRTPGIYEIRTGDRLVRRVAFNADSRESDLSILSTNDARARLEQATGRSVGLLDARGTEQTVAQVVNQQRFGVELWNVFLALALLFLVAEMFVAMQWRPEPVAA